MDSIQRAIANPPRKIVMQRAARRKVFWNRPPLAASAQDVHHAVHDGPHIGPPLTAAASGGRDQRPDMRPFVIGQITRISQVIAVVFRPVLVPMEAPPRIMIGPIESNRLKGIKKSPREGLWTNERILQDCAARRASMISLCF
jgi:hypothetical protein